MSRRIKYYLLFLCFISSVIMAKDFYSFYSVNQEKQFQYLVSHLRCVVCQDESLQSSQAKIALEIKHKIAVMIRNHESNQEIQFYLVKRYGDFVLLKPPFIAETYFLWLAPCVLLVGVGVGVWLRLSLG